MGIKKDIKIGRSDEDEKKMDISDIGNFYNDRMF